MFSASMASDFRCCLTPTCLWRGCFVMCLWHGVQMRFRPICQCDMHWRIRCEPHMPSSMPFGVSVRVLKPLILLLQCIVAALLRAGMHALCSARRVGCASECNPRIAVSVVNAPHLVRRFHRLVGCALLDPVPSCFDCKDNAVVKPWVLPVMCTHHSLQLECIIIISA